MRFWVRALGNGFSLRNLTGTSLGLSASRLEQSGIMGGAHGGAQGSLPAQTIPGFWDSLPNPLGLTGNVVQLIPQNRNPERKVKIPMGILKKMVFKPMGTVSKC